MHTTPLRRSRARITLLAITVLGAVALGVNVAGAADEEPGDGLSSAHITITQELDEQTDEVCVSRTDGLSFTMSDTEEAITYVVTVSAPLCDPVDDAAAVIYDMIEWPDSPWPQTLSEKVSFTLGEKGVTTIRFAKDCDPVQYDVLSGATPEMVMPVVGPLHGPLLFPNNLDGYGGSSVQFTGLGGENCTDNTSGSSSTSSTTSTTEDTTPDNPTPEVESVTTIATPGAGNEAGTAPAATVGGVTASQSAGPAALSISG